jgi:hypothetical protein
MILELSSAVFYLIDSDSKAGFCLRHRAELTQVGPIETWWRRKNLVSETYWNKNNNIQNCDNYINIPSSQT